MIYLKKYNESLEDIHQDINDILLELLDSGYYKINLFSNAVRIVKVEWPDRRIKSNELDFNEIKEYVLRIIDYLGDKYVRCRYFLLALDNSKSIYGYNDLLPNEDTEIKEGIVSFYIFFEEKKEIKTFELFTFSNDIKVIVNLPDEFKCSFVIGSDEYFFHARDENKMFPEFIRYGWHLTFGIVSNDKYKLTNKNIPFKVLSGVKECFKMFIDKYKPSSVSFIAEGESKANIYLKMLVDDGDVVKSSNSGLKSYSEYPAILYMIDKMKYLKKFE